MVKILKPGNGADTRWPYTVVLRCFTCGCEFKLELGDAFRIEDIDVPDQRESGQLVHAPCPNCRAYCAAR